MLEVAREIAPLSRVVQADLTRNDVLAGQKFDLITAFRFFPNAEPELRREAMETLCSKLRTGGCLVLNNHQNHSSLPDRVRRILTTKPFLSTPAREILELISSFGLEIIKVYHVGIVPDHEKLLLRPRFLVEWTESLLTRFPAASLSQNVIYACKKGDAPVG